MTITRAEPRHLKAVLDPLAQQASISVRQRLRHAALKRVGRPLKLETPPTPGFPTDMQAQMCALLATTDGISVITENVFPQRFMHVAELKRMGANIELQGSTAVINGVEKLSGAPVMAIDLRASAALVLAGLQAENSTEINRVYHIDRGYESLDEKLNSLGAQIERVKA